MANKKKRKKKHARRGEKLATDHHRRWLACIIPGEIDVGGLDRVTPVVGLTMGMLLLTRAADCCW
jgi:hypothetical protein